MAPNRCADTDVSFYHLIALFLFCFVFDYLQVFFFFFNLLFESSVMFPFCFGLSRPFMMLINNAKCLMREDKLTVTLDGFSCSQWG